MTIYECTILIVDDQRELAEMVKGMLERSGYLHVCTAGTVREAMEVFMKEKPRLVILDIMLPDGDGFSLFRRMRKEEEAPILFLSAKDQDNDRLFGLGLGADDYVTKPFLPEELVLRVARF